MRLDSALLVRPWRTAFDTRRRIDEEPSSVPRIRAMSSSMLKSPPALHRGSLGDTLGERCSLEELMEVLGVCCAVDPDGGAGGARGCMYVSLTLDSLRLGRTGRAGGASSGGVRMMGPEEALPLTIEA